MNWQLLLAIGGAFAAFATALLGLALRSDYGDTLESDPSGKLTKRLTPAGWLLAAAYCVSLFATIAGLVLQEAKNADQRAQAEQEFAAILSGLKASVGASTEASVQAAKSSTLAQEASSESKYASRAAGDAARRAASAAVNSRTAAERGTKTIAELQLAEARQNTTLDRIGLLLDQSYQMFPLGLRTNSVLGAHLEFVIPESELVKLVADWTAECQAKPFHSPVPGVYAVSHPPFAFALDRGAVAEYLSPRHFIRQFLENLVVRLELLHSTTGVMPTASAGFRAQVRELVIDAGGRRAKVTLEWSIDSQYWNATGWPHTWRDLPGKRLRIYVSNGADSIALPKNFDSDAAAAYKSLKVPTFSLIGGRHTLNLENRDTPTIRYSLEKTSDGPGISEWEFRDDWAGLKNRLNLLR